MPVSNLDPFIYLFPHGRQVLGMANGREARCLCSRRRKGECYCRGWSGTKKKDI